MTPAEMGGGTTAPTITGDHQNRVTDYTAIVCEVIQMKKYQACDVYNQTVSENAQTLPAAVGGGNTSGCKIIEEEKTMDDVSYIVRRLTPMECERLQGFPDTWTMIGEPEEVEVKDYDIQYDEDGNEVSKTQIGTHTEIAYFYTDDNGKKKRCPDSARYKALGNSIALPQWWWLFNKMKPFLRERATLGSLFDGIGGFPLTFEETFGKGTARWASEIEEFPIAVTKYHFPEVEL